jgi:hypothetical protein
MVEHVITLRLKLKPIKGQDNPAEWDWAELLDLGLEESVEIIETPGDYTGEEWSK